MAGNIHYFECDVGNKESVDNAKKQIEEKLGPVTILVNNAGIVRADSVLDAAPEDIQRYFEI